MKTDVSIEVDVIIIGEKRRHLKDKASVQVHAEIVRV